MLSNKIVPDKSRAGNENSAHVGRAGIYNEPMPMPSDGGVARASPPNDLPKDRGICSSTPMTLDPHANARHSNENRTVAPGEVSRSARTTEIHRRLEDRTPKYRY
jgi:hypothetical protein